MRPRSGADIGIVIFLGIACVLGGVFWLYLSFIREGPWFQGRLARCQESIGEAKAPPLRVLVWLMGTRLRMVIVASALIAFGAVLIWG